jgi:hypothetical protein
MRAMDRLHVHLRVPVGVIYDDFVSSLQIDPLPSCAGGEEEEELRGALALEALNLFLSFSADSLPIDSAKRVVSIHTVVLQDVEHAGQLKATYTSSWRPHIRAAEGLIH